MCLQHNWYCSRGSFDCSAKRRRTEAGYSTKLKSISRATLTPSLTDLETLTLFLLWRRLILFQPRLIDFSKPFPPTRSIAPVLKGCFLTSELVLHLCVKVLRLGLKITIYWLLYNVSCRSPSIWPCVQPSGPRSGEKGPCILIAVRVDAVTNSLREARFLRFWLIV